MVPDHFGARVMMAAMRYSRVEPDESWVTNVLLEMRVGDPAAFPTASLFLRDDRCTCLICGWTDDTRGTAFLDHRRLHHEQVSHVLGVAREEPSWEHTDEPAAG